MEMATTETHWTVDMLHALPEDGKRYEIIDGELFVTPAPSPDHQEAVIVLLDRLRPYTREHSVGHLVIAPGAVEVRRDTEVEPDVFVTPLVNGKRPRTWREAGRPLLVVEVLSPGSARTDRIRKRELYQSMGVPEYWIVDLDTRAVERWRPGDERPEILVTSIEWQTGAAHPALVIDLDEYFREVFDE
jgi:Uma2 family endonuclease